MSWHRQHTIGAAFTHKDASQVRPLCRACVEGTMRQASTDHRRVHRPLCPIPGSQFTLDAYSHGFKSQSGYLYADLLTDLTTRRVYPIFTKDRSAVELCKQASKLFDSHPEWRDTGSAIDRFVRTDPENNYSSDLFVALLTHYGYRREHTAPRDKHANGVAERSVGLMSAKTNLAMLAPFPTVPQKYWDLAFDYACLTQSFNYNTKINTSSYNFITGSHVNVKYLHGFWSKCYVHIPTKECLGKVGFPRAYKARFVGYDYTHLLEPSFKVIEVKPNGTYGQVRISRDVIFDDTIDFKDPNTIYPPDEDFEFLHPDEQDKALQCGPIIPIIPDAALIDQDLPPLPQPLPLYDIPAPAPHLPAALPRQDARAKKVHFGAGSKIPFHAGIYNHPLVAPTPPPESSPVPVPRIPLTRSQRKPVTYTKIPPPIPIPDPDAPPVGINTPVVTPEEGDMIYWYSTSVRNHEYNLSVIETSHFLQLGIPIDPHVPKTFWKAMAIPEWKVAIDTELRKFETNACLEFVPFTGQHLVPMMWLFNIKNDGTRKARLVGRGDMMIPLVDFDPDAVYCGNVSACSIKIAVTIAAAYCLVMRGGDLVGAYLITRANPAFPVYITGTLAYQVPEGFCIQAVGNLYGFPPAGQNFSKEFDKCLREAGYKNTPWDLKLFFKWTPCGKPMIVIAHSDDFRWFGPPDYTHEWDSLVATFNSHGYQVTDATDKEFVGIKITHDEDFNYYMDQHRMIDSIVKEANIIGASNAHLPYPTTAEQPPLSKQDCASTPEEKERCSKYPYRRVVGQLMYGMVHTMVCILYALNILSRYGNNPGDRHILFLKHLLRYVKYTRDDRLKFRSHPGPYDMDTMQPLMQLHFQCDADLGGNRDNDHSQTSYLGYLNNNLICWCSTDQGSVSTSTAESEIKAVNHTLKAEIIANRGILNMIGWAQNPTRIEEDNQACVYHAKSTHMTRNLRHLDLTESYIKDKVADGTCYVVKVDSANNNSDIGTKRVTLPIFTKLTSQIVDRSLRTNL